jgi:hypothetical protein
VAGNGWFLDLIAFLSIVSMTKSTFLFFRPVSGIRGIRNGSKHLETIQIRVDAQDTAVSNITPKTPIVAVNGKGSLPPGSEVEHVSLS